MKLEKAIKKFKTKLFKYGFGEVHDTLPGSVMLHMMYILNDEPKSDKINDPYAINVKFLPTGMICIDIIYRNHPAVTGNPIPVEGDNDFKGVALDYCEIGRVLYMGAIPPSTLGMDLLIRGTVDIYVRNKNYHGLTAELDLLKFEDDSEKDMVSLLCSNITIDEFEKTLSKMILKMLADELVEDIEPDNPGVCNIIQ